ncbi:MAG: DUF5343 domain-containing protein [Dehalococcoidales bacterium]|nr:DUF5343 domain-containing protein [Dehalococcoidales bacterium]
MPVEFPYTSKPEDIAGLFQILDNEEIPSGAVDAEFFESRGFSADSSGYLPEILKKLGFVDDTGNPSPAWQSYYAAENKGILLASAVKTAYAELFYDCLCPYLMDNEYIMDFLEHNVQASPEEIENMLMTFRNLIEPADFQDLLPADDHREDAQPAGDTVPLPNVKIDPNLQVNIQLHIDPATPDEKIETIFKNMRKYLLGKDD